MPKSNSRSIIGVLGRTACIASVWIATAASPAVAAGGQAQIHLPPGVTPQVGMTLYATDNCLYAFDGSAWHPQVQCRYFPDPRNAQVFDLFDRSTGQVIARIDLSEPGWVKERAASGPAANIWRKVPLRDLMTHGQLGPNNTYRLVGTQWIKELDLQNEADLQRERELLAAMTPEQAEVYLAAKAKREEMEHRIKMRILGYVPAIR